MIKRFLGGGLAATIGLLGLSTSVAQAQAARPAAHLPGVHVISLHAAYERALPTARSGKPSGIVYAIGHTPKAARTAGSAGCTEPNCNLVYHGGPVQHDPRVYLLLWGPAWNTASERATATYLESFLKGLGAQPQDNWSATTAQYGDSSGFPSFSGSVYKGVWQDTSVPPSGIGQNGLAAEADAFAKTHRLTGDVNAQIVIATQSGTCPNGFYAPGTCGSNSGYCAWHTNSVNTGVTFTNLPYLLDAGSGCGEYAVNSASQGLYDGFSIVEGHEYAETITDPNPDSGWIDIKDKVSGGEIGDKCAWIMAGPGALADVTLSTGTFAMQSLWSNRAGGCVMSTTADALTVTDPGAQTSTSGTAVRLQMTATSGSGARLEFAATGLPAGLKVGSVSGLITGTPTTPGSGSVTVTVTDGTNARKSVTFGWTVNQGKDTITVTNPGNQVSYEGATVHLQIHATSSTGATLTYQATGLAAPLSINSATGLITGTFGNGAGAGQVTVTVTDTAGASASVTFQWKVIPPDFQIRGYRYQCLTDYRYLAAPGTKVVIYPCDNLLREKWISGPHNSLRIRGLCLTDPNWGRWRTRQVLEPCTGWKNQQWTLNQHGEYVVAVHNLCLTDPNWSTRQDTQVIIQSCRRWKNQLWTKQ